MMDKRALDKEAMDFLWVNLSTDAEIHAEYQNGCQYIKAQGSAVGLFSLCCGIVKSLAQKDLSGNAQGYVDMVAKAVKSELEEGGV